MAKLKLWIDRCTTLVDGNRTYRGKVRISYGYKNLITRYCFDADSGETIPIYRCGKDRVASDRNHSSLTIVSRK